MTKKHFELTFQYSVTNNTDLINLIFNLISLRVHSNDFKLNIFSILTQKIILKPRFYIFYCHYLEIMTLFAFSIFLHYTYFIWFPGINFFIVFFPIRCISFLRSLDLYKLYYVHIVSRISDFFSEFSHKSNELCLLQKPTDSVSDVLIVIV